MVMRVSSSSCYPQYYPHRRMYVSIQILMLNREVTSNQSADCKSPGISIEVESTVIIVDGLASLFTASGNNLFVSSQYAPSKEEHTVLTALTQLLRPCGFSTHIPTNLNSSCLLRQ